MLWLTTNNLNFKKSFRKIKYKCNLSIKNVALNLNYKTQSLSVFKFYLYIPSLWNFIILKNYNNGVGIKLVYLYSNTYFFKILLHSINMQFFYDKQVRLFSVKNTYKYNFYSMFLKKILSIYYSFARLVFIKLKFKGKGYYIYKNIRNTITPQFGYAHRIYIYAYFISVKFLSKTKVFLFGLSKNDLLTVGYNIKISKPINIFTGRGVRFAKQVIYKKTGKVSSYR